MQLNVEERQPSPGEDKKQKQFRLESKNTFLAKIKFCTSAKFAA